MREEKQRKEGVSFPTISDWFDHQLLSEMVKCLTHAKSLCFLWYCHSALQSVSIAPR